jgi:aspartyl-tRNA synthetase
VRSEYVICVQGTVRERPEGTANPNLATGQVDVMAHELRVLNRAKTPPFYIEDGIDVDENLRLRYRYLDLRRPEMQKAVMLRHRAAKSARDYLDENGFLEIETPVLTRAHRGGQGLPGASRLNPANFTPCPSRLSCSSNPDGGWF